MATTNKPPSDKPPGRPGRPPGRGSAVPRPKTRKGYNLSLDLDLIDWLKEQPEGPAAVANRIIRREMERQRKRQG